MDFKEKIIKCHVCKENSIFSLCNLNRNQSNLNLQTEMNGILVNKLGFKAKIELIFEKDRNLHILFWILMFVFLLILDRSQSDFHIKLFKSFISVGVFASIVYINWNILIPKFLKQRNWVLYLTSLIFLTILITPPHVLALFLLYEDYPSYQSFFFDNQNILLFQSIFVGASSTAFKITQDWLSHERDKKELQSQNLASELNFLKSQINPHFLFNTLNNLYALSLKKSDQAPETVLMLSEMMRYMLYECNVEKVNLSKEINYLKNYLELEKIRLGRDFDINFKVHGEVDELQIAPLMFIPFIENSFKHGMNNSISDGFVYIDLFVNEGKITMKIKNNSGHEILKNIKNNNSGGIGLINIKRRLKLIYPNKHTLDIEHTENTYTVNLSIQLT